MPPRSPHASAVIGPIIPPSIPMVLYALISDASVGYLFLRRFIPGLLIGIAFMVINSIIARRREFPVEPAIPMREMAEYHDPRLSRADDACDPALRHLQRSHDATEGAAARRLLRFSRLRCSIRSDVAAAL